VARSAALGLIVALALSVAASSVVGRALDEGRPVDRPTPSTPPSTTPPSVVTPPDDLVGYSGFPADGAVPSTPEVGELVVDFSVGRGIKETTQYFVYADGRLIWQRGEETNAATGWLEQRLTPEGVQMLRSLFTEHSADPEHPSEWLPEQAWASEDIVPFVPARFEANLIFYGAGEQTPDDPSTLIPPADQMLRDADEVDRGQSCEMVTLAEAQELARQFTKANAATGNPSWSPDAMPYIGLGFSWAELRAVLPHVVECAPL
jgi:hypothetical protein